MSITIQDFFVSLSDWVSVEQPIRFSVNAVSVGSPVTASGTYFELNGDILSTAINDLGSDTYRLESAPVTISGQIDLNLYISNSLDEIAGNYYSFLYGYHVEYSDSEADWGPSKEVSIRASANNTVICPNKESYETYFVTKDYDFVGLTSSIVPQGWKHLSSYIKGQSKVFEYGRTYKIKISGVKDFSGNEMDEFEFSFTIEDY